jgi:hypothetical protein
MVQTSYNPHDYEGPGIRQYVPPGGYLLHVGAVGAMAGGGWAAFSDISRVRNQQISRNEAISHTVTNAAIGAGAGLVVGAAAYLARHHPLAGTVAVLAVGVGALYLAGKAKTEQSRTIPVSREPEKKGAARVTGARRRRSGSTRRAIGSAKS